MTGKAQVRALVAEIGPLLELGEVTAFDAEDLWTLVVDGETVLFLDYEQGQERLWLSGEVATPPPSERARLHETLLTYNHRWRDTGGLRMSLDGEGGAVVLSYDMPAAGLELSRLAMVVTNFLDVLRAWREGIGRIASAPSAGLAEAPFNPMMMGMIRG